MRNCTQDELDVITIGVQNADSGKVYNVNGVIGVAEGDADTVSPYKVPLKTEGIFTLAKQTGFTAAIGDLAFYDIATDKRLEAFSFAGTIPIGFYAAAAASGDTTASVIFDPKAAETALEIHMLPLRFKANDVQCTSFVARRAGKVVGLSYYTMGKPSSALGAVTLTSNNVGVSDNDLFSSLNLETITDNALTAITLTVTPADLVVAQGGVVEFVVTSDNADGNENDGVDLFIYFQRT